MIRKTLDELTWEAYSEVGDDILEHLAKPKREFVSRVFGIFPYQPHSIRQMSKLLGIPLTSTHRRYRDILKELKIIALNLYKNP